MKSCAKIAVLPSKCPNFISDPMTLAVWSRVVHRVKHIIHSFEMSALTCYGRIKSYDHSKLTKVFLLG